MYLLPPLQINNLGAAQAPPRPISQSARGQGLFEALLHSAGTVRGEANFNALAGINTGAGAVAVRPLDGHAQQLIAQFLAHYLNILNGNAENSQQLTGAGPPGKNSASAGLAILNEQSQSGGAFEGSNSPNRPDLSNQSPLGYLSAAILSLLREAAASLDQEPDSAGLPQSGSGNAPWGSAGLTDGGQIRPSYGATLSLPRINLPPAIANLLWNPNAPVPQGQNPPLVNFSQDMAYSMQNALASASETIFEGAMAAQRRDSSAIGPGEDETVIESLRNLLKTMRLASQSRALNRANPPSEGAISKPLSAVLTKAPFDARSFSASGLQFKMGNFLEFLSRQLGLASMDIGVEKADYVTPKEKNASRQGLADLNVEANGYGSSIRADSYLRALLQKLVDASQKIDFGSGLGRSIASDEHGQISSSQAQPEQGRASAATTPPLIGHDGPEASPMVESDEGGEPAILTSLKGRYDREIIYLHRAAQQDRPLSASDLHEPPHGNGGLNHADSVKSLERSGNQETVRLSKDGFEAPATGQKEMISQLADKASMAIREGKGFVKIHLQPEHLGNVRLEIVTQNHSVRANFIVESSAVKDAIQANLHQLRESLLGQGLKADNFSVSVGFDSNGGPWFHANRFGEGAHSGGADLLGDVSLEGAESDVVREAPARLLGPASSLDIFA